MSQIQHDRLQIGPFIVFVERRKARSVFGRRRREGLRLIVQRDGSIKVSAPLRATLQLVENFVLTNVEWIETQQAKARDHQAVHPPKQFIAGEKIHLFGLERELIFEEPPDGRQHTVRSGAVALIENFLVVTLPKSERSVAMIHSLVCKFFDQQARLHLPERVDYFSKMMGVKPSGLSFRRQKTRWGSCSPSGHISLNWKIVFAPEDVIDYLVVHELAHLVHANHSKYFWDLVKIYSPECQKHRRWLRTHQFETSYLDALTSVTE